MLCEVCKWKVTGADKVHWQAVVPLNQMRQILRYSHDMKASGHLGETKMLNYV